MNQLDNNIYIQRCFQIAQLGLGNAAPNPLVGSVIVHNDRIIGEGWHQRNGTAHAEVNAVNSVREKDRPLLKESTIYVSLEPCFHYGKTPPCVDLILKHKIPKVVISCTDPFPKVAGQSIAKLKANNIDVTSNILVKEGRYTARRFFTTVQHRRPYVILKYAQSKDGFMGQVDQQVWISNAFSKRLAHKWRYEESAIMVGTNTAKIDNPNLSNRLWYGKSPLRIVLDKTARLSPKLNLFDGSIPTLIFGEQSPKIPLHKNLQFKKIAFDETMLDSILAHLHELKISSLIVEGGCQLLNSFIGANAWDEARVFTSDDNLGHGIPSPKLNGILQKKERLVNNTISTYIPPRLPS